MKTKLFICFSMLFLFLPLGVQGLEIYTEEDPPYSLTGKDGSPTGFGVEVVNEIQKRIGGKEQVSIIPWARAYDYVKNRDGIVVFTMSRTKERENLFQWVGPIIESKWVFIGKKGSGVKISSLQEAKKLKSIGVVSEYAWEKYLTSEGFTNLDKVNKHEFNVKKLGAKRIDAIVCGDLSYIHDITEAGLDPNDFEILYSFKSVQMYIAHSKGTDKAIVKKWQSTLDSMKKDGTFLKLLIKWIPKGKMPGPAKPEAYMGFGGRSLVC